MESELFGHERGAFTGAVERKLGRLEMAGAGTIVLDEVAALSAPTQSKLLRVLEERRFERLGGTETLSIDGASDRAHQRRPDARRLRRPFPRGPVFPPERADHSRAPACASGRRISCPWPNTCSRAWLPCMAAPTTTLSEAARKALQAYDWPGNIRELRNSIERALVFAKNSTLEPADFSDSIRATESGLAGTMRSLEEIEREVIQATLEATHYKISRSAEILGISRKTLLDKRKRYGLQ